MKGTMPLREDYPLEKFNNLELYYFVSGLLGLGDPGSTPERLYLSFDQNQLDAVPDIKFLFLTQNIIYEDESEKEVVEYYLGKIDRAFDNIEIYQWHFYPHVAPSVSSFQPTLNDYESPSIFRPVSLLKGINRILSEGKFNRRAGNNLFDVKPHVNIPNDIQNQFDFKEIGPLGTNFSGNYFLIVEPEQKKGGVIVNSFQIDILQSQGRLPFDCETVNIHRHFIDGSSVQSYENGEPNSVFTQLFQQKHERHQEHKIKMLTVLTETVMGLLPNLSPSTRSKVLESETPEELIIYCKEKYNQEFDLNVDDLGIAGAHEIAWEEALAMFNEEYWGTGPKNTK